MMDVKIDMTCPYHIMTNNKGVTAITAVDGRWTDVLVFDIDTVGYACLPTSTVIPPNFSVDWSAMEMTIADQTIDIRRPTHLRPVYIMLQNRPQTERCRWTLTSQTHMTWTIGKQKTPTYDGTYRSMYNVLMSYFTVDPDVIRYDVDVMFRTTRTIADERQTVNLSEALIELVRWLD